MPEITKTTASRDIGSMDAVGVLTADQETLPKIQAKAESVNYVEARPAVGLAPSAPITPLSDKIKTIGDSRMAARKLDPDFENWKNQALLPSEEEVNTLRQLKQMKVSKWDQIVSDATAQTEKDMKTVEKTTAAPRTFAKEAVFGVLDAANRGTQALIDLHNAGANFFGVESLDQLPDLAEVLPEPTNEGEAFVRSSARFLTGFLPISRGVKALAGVGGVVNSAVSSGLTGFIFDDEKTDGVVAEFLKDNVSISEPVLKYLNHEIDDSQFQTRLKNAANYAVDDLLFEGLFAGFRALKYKSAAQEGAYRILDNGDIEVKAEKLSDTDVPSIESFKIAGLTTEESSKKPLSDILKEKYVDAEQAFRLQQEAKPDRKRISREQSMKAVTSSPEDMASLINRLSQENVPVNQEDVLKATLAQKALMDTADEVIGRFQKGELNEVVAFRQLDGISNMITTLSNPRSTAGRALEITKQAYEIMGDEKFNSAAYKKMRDLYGRDMRTVLEEIRLNKEVMTGFSPVDSLVSAKRKVGGNVKKIAQFMQAARINWILSDPTIHAVNVLSNTANLGLRAGTQQVAEGISLGKSLVYGNKYKARGVQSGEAVAMMRGYIKGMLDVASKINQNIGVLVEDKSLYSPRYKSLFEKDSNNKYIKELPFLEEESAVANNFADAPLHMKFGTVVKDLVGGTPVGKLLSWEDDAFKGVVYASELEKELHVLQEISRRKVSEMQTSGIPKEEVDAFVKSETDKFAKLREDMAKGIIPSDIEEKAIEAANVWTYNNINKDPDIVSRGLRASGEFINNMPFMKWFVPFFNTGSNILNQGVEYTPVLGALVKSGNFGGAAGLLRGGKEADVFLAKQAIGGVVAASAAMFIANMEEQYGEEFSITSIKENKGGIKIGDTEIPLDKQNPILKLIIASRDVMDIANVAESDEGAGAAANALVTVLAEMYSPEQLINVLGAFGELNKAGREELPIVFQNMVKNNILSSVAPYSGAARFVNRDILGMDKPEFGSDTPGFAGVVDEMMGRIKFTYLGNDTELPKKRGLFGQEIPYLRSFGFAVTNSAHSLFAGYSQDDMVVKELMNLSREDIIANPANYDSYILNDTAIFDMPSKSITLPTGSKYGELYKLSPSQYSEYVKYSADLGIQGVPTLKSALERVISSEEYQGIPNQFKIAQIKRIIGLYRKAAKAKIIADDPAILDEARATAMQILQEVGRE